MKLLKPVCRPALAAAAALILAGPAWAHHGFGQYDMDHELKEYKGTVDRFYLVNPHSYVIFTVQKDGKPFQMQCGMRSATLLKRSGWPIAMFKPGVKIDVLGHPHRSDPHHCYVESITLGGTTINRNEQFSGTSDVDTSNRPLETASGDPNISGDWAVEEGVLTVPPGGGRGAIVPKHLREAFATGKITLQQIRAQYPRSPRPVYTPAGEAAAKAFKMRSQKDNPRFSCKVTSILFDWTFDWPINRILQHKTASGQKVIDITYGSYNAKRRIWVGMDAHPANLTPSRAGNSIGHWEGDTLVVDTIGFKPGVLVPPTRNSDKLHIIEHFTLNTKDWSLTHTWTAMDPVYLAQPYKGSDINHLSEVPYQNFPCKDLTYAQGGTVQ